MGVIPSDSERSLGFPLWSVSLYWYLISYWIGWSSFPIKVEHLVGVMGLNQWMTNSFIGTKSRLPHIISAVQCSLVRWCVEVLKYYREVFKRDELLDVRYGWCSRRSVDDKVKHRIYPTLPSICATIRLSFLFLSSINHIKLFIVCLLNTPRLLYMTPGHLLQPTHPHWIICGMQLDTETVVMHIILNGSISIMVHR